MGSSSRERRPRGEARLVLEGARLLAERELFGFVLLDSDLVVSQRYGSLVRFVTQGAHIAESVLPLVGLDEQIQELRQRTSARLEVPAVAIKRDGAPRERLNLTVSWLDTLDRFLLLVARTQGHDAIELQMSRLMRARLMAEAEATARAQELARVNRDLDEFASIVSHDLKAPMRAIRFLADELEAMLGGSGSGDPAATLARIREQSRRMTLMLAQLHEYARAGYKQNVAQEVDTGVLVSSIIASLPRPSRMRVETAGDWPTLVTLVSPLDLVLRNLIENAIKHHDRAVGLITVEACQLRDALEIAVSDDGPGIPLHYHDIAFQPFRTLREGEEGGGMGLAFVKKTLEAVGGRIEIVSDSAIARGTRLVVTWPVSSMR